MNRVPKKKKKKKKKKRNIKFAGNITINHIFPILTLTRQIIMILQGLQTLCHRNAPQTEKKKIHRQIATDFELKEKGLSQTTAKCDQVARHIMQNQPIVNANTEHRHSVQTSAVHIHPGSRQIMNNL